MAAVVAAMAEVVAASSTVLLSTQDVVSMANAAAMQIKVRMRGLSGIDSHLARAEVLLAVDGVARR